MDAYLNLASCKCKFTLRWSPASPKRENHAQMQITSRGRPKHCFCFLFCVDFVFSSQEQGKHKKTKKEKNKQTKKKQRRTLFRSTPDHKRAARGSPWTAGQARLQHFSGSALHCHTHAFLRTANTRTKNIFDTHTSKIESTQSLWSEGKPFVGFGGAVGGPGGDFNDHDS